MSAAHDAYENLRCPDCGEPLSRSSDSEMICVGCDARYPVRSGVPWLFRDVDGTRAQWAAKLQFFRQELLAELAEMAADQGRDGLLETTQERLRRQHAGLERLGQQVFSLMEGFELSHSEAGRGIARDRIPSRQHVTSYLETAFRDWCWGEEEIAETMSLVCGLIPEMDDSPPVASSQEEAPQRQSALVVGGGAGRFAWELGQRIPTCSVIQLDLNPLLTQIARAVADGEAIELTELPRFAQSVEDAAVDQILRRPSKAAAASPLFILGDAFAPPFAKASFDLLVTPWFVDIVPERFPNLVRRLGQLLSDGGRWVSFGPTSFESHTPGDRLTPEEMVEVLEGEGFEVDSAGLEDVRYLHSPHGMPRRGERIFLFSATRGVMLREPEPHSYYPEWMLDPRTAIPAEPRFEAMRAERTFDVEILKCIDGRASIEDIVIILSSRFGLEPDRCRNTINRFFARLVEGGEGGGPGGG